MGIGLRELLVVGVICGVFSAVMIALVMIVVASARKNRTYASTKLTPCPDCNQAVSTRAQTCPRCGAPLKSSA